MKATLIILFGFAAILTGCVVTSIGPYYTQKDLVFEPSVLGTWNNIKKPGESWHFEKNGDFAYRFTLYESLKTTVMDAHAFKLAGQLFLDVYSLERDYHVIPVHYVLKVNQQGISLNLSELNDDWLKSLLVKDPAALHHQFVDIDGKPEDQRIVLTGETPELQEFLVEYLKTEAAWKATFQLRRDFDDESSGAVCLSPRTRHGDTVGHSKSP